MGEIRKPTSNIRQFISYSNVLKLEAILAAHRASLQTLPIDLIASRGLKQVYLLTLMDRATLPHTKLPIPHCTPSDVKSPSSNVHESDI